MKPVIGILGGMGPRVTVDFERLLLSRLTGNDQELPVIITINDGRIPDRSAFLLGRGADPVPRLQRNLEMLEAMGVSVICLPCNTACMPPIFDRLRPRISRLLSLPREVALVLGRRSVRRIFLLATAGTIDSGEYQRLCRELGIDCQVPDRKVQEVVSSIIAAIKSGNIEMARPSACIIERQIRQQQADAVILGCTELPAIKEYLVPKGVTAIDTLEVLADACLSYTGEELSKGAYDESRPVYA